MRQANAKVPILLGKQTPKIVFGSHASLPQAFVSQHSNSSITSSQNKGKQSQVTTKSQESHVRPIVRLINEDSGAKNMKESFKSLNMKDNLSQPDSSVNNNSVNNSVSRSVKKDQKQLMVRSTKTISIPVKQDNLTSTTQKPKKISSGYKQQMISHSVDRTKPRNSQSPDRLGGGERSPFRIEPFVSKKLILVSPPANNIIEENPFQEDDQCQGQGDQEIKDTDSNDRRRRKSITLFEMHYDTLENEMLGHLRQDTHDEESSEEESEHKLQYMKETIERLSAQTSEALAQKMKVLINGLFDEREFYIDIGQIPQNWRIKRLANLLNKMYSNWNQNNELPNPVLSMLIGRVHTRKLDENMKIFELIDLAVSGILGPENLIVLEDQ